MKKIEILEPCLIAGEHREIGDIVEITDDEARVLSSCQRVRYVTDETQVDEVLVDESKGKGK